MIKSHYDDSEGNRIDIDIDTASAKASGIGGLQIEVDYTFPNVPRNNSRLGRKYGSTISVARLYILFSHKYNRGVGFIDDYLKTIFYYGSLRRQIEDELESLFDEVQTTTELKREEKENKGKLLNAILEELSRFSRILKHFKRPSKKKSLEENENIRKERAEYKKLIAKTKSDAKKVQGSEKKLVKGLKKSEGRELQRWVDNRGRYFAQLIKDDIIEAMVSQRLPFARLPLAERTIEIKERIGSRTPKVFGVASRDFIEHLRIKIKVRGGKWERKQYQSIWV